MEVATIAVYCPVDSGGLDSSFTGRVKAARQIKITMNDQSFGVDLADVASIQIEMRNFSLFEDDSLSDRTLAHRQRERDSNVRQIEAADDPRAQDFDSRTIDELRGRGIFAEPRYKRGADVSLMRPLVRVPGVVARIGGIGAGTSDCEWAVLDVARRSEREHRPLGVSQVGKFRGCERDE